MMSAQLSVMRFATAEFNAIQDLMDTVGVPRVIGGVVLTASERVAMMVAAHLVACGKVGAA